MAKYVRCLMKMSLYIVQAEWYNGAMKRIYLFGSLNADLTIRAPYLPKAGETLTGSDFMLTAGGKGANQAYAAANLGGRVHMAGCVGEDPFGDMLLTSLQKAGADVSHVRRTARGTGVAVILLSDGDNRIVLDRGANGEAEGADVDALLASAEAGDIFMTQLETPFEVVRYALKAARARGLFTVFNPAPAVREAQELVPLADLITPNETELAILTGEERGEEGCRKLLAMGAGAVLATCGAHGSLYCGQDGIMPVACVHVGKAVDTTAAGDTFCGALAVRLAEGAGIAEAAKFASLCAGVSVTRRGAQISMPSRREVDEIAVSLHE